MAVRSKTLMLFLVLCLCPVLYVVLTESGVIYKLNHTGARNSSLEFAGLSSDPPVKRILLVTYGRSGSTFTSYILKEAPGAFFFFEPLRPELLRSTQGRNDVIMSYKALGGTYMKPQELPISNLTSYERKALNIIENLFNCDISKYPVTDYHSSHFRLHGDSAKVSNCLWNMVNDTYLNLSHYLQCLVRFWHSCQVSRLRIFKVIRLPLRALFSLMRKFKDLRVVYLVRDPRAVLMSQAAHFGHAPKPEDYCGMVLDDARHMELLREAFPGRSVTVRYEDICNDPLQWTRRLYRALELTMTPRVEGSVRRMTSATGVKEGVYTSFRSDSREAANKWRTKISYAVVQRVDAVCEEVYKWLGYKAVPSETVLRNSNVSMRGPSHRVPLL